MTKDQLIVCKFEPNKEKEFKYIDNNHFSIKRELGDVYLEALRITDRLVAFVDEEFKLKENHLSSINFLLTDRSCNVQEYLCGTVLFFDVDEEGSNTSLSDESIEFIHNNIQTGFTEVDGEFKKVNVLRLYA